MTDVPSDLHPRQEAEPHRIQALTDGVFAIVMTLLVIELKPPLGPDSHLADELAHMLPELGVFFLTMLLLGGLWFRHRTEFVYLQRADRTLIWLNLGMLAFVSLVPWTASLVGAHPRSGLAVCVFNVNLVIAWLFQQSSWLYATGRRHLSGDIRPQLIRASRLVGFIAVADFTVAALIAPWSPMTALVIDLLAPMFYVTGLSWRLLHRLSR